MMSPMRGKMTGKWAARLLRRGAAARGARTGGVRSLSGAGFPESADDFEDKSPLHPWSGSTLPPLRVRTMG
jgi:hypothetical protein